MEPKAGKRVVVVLGGRGMLGTDTVAGLAASPDFEPVAWDLPELDIRSEPQIRQAIAGAWAVVNCAAYTNVEGAESDPETARQVNAEAVAGLARATAENGQYLLHISTDFVFDGALDRPYSEDDRTMPLSVYGQTKLEGERAALTAGGDSAVVRLQWTYGRAGKAFVHKILARARQTGRVRVVSDQSGSPTWTRDAAEALIELLAARRTGLFHYAAEGAASRYEVAEFIVRGMGLECQVEPCLTRDFPTSAARPLNSRFDCARIDGILRWPRPRWQDSLTLFLATLKKDTAA